MKKIIGFGDGIVDCVFVDGKFFKYDGGGSAFNVLYNLTKFSKRFECFASGIIGTDACGEIVKKSLNVRGINTDNIVSDPTLSTNLIFINIAESKARYSPVCKSCGSCTWRADNYLNKHAGLDFDFLLFDLINNEMLQLLEHKLLHSVACADIDKNSFGRNFKKSYVESFIKKLKNLDYVQFNGKAFDEIKNMLGIKTDLDLYNLLNVPIVSITRGEDGTTLLYKKPNKIEQRLIKHSFFDITDATGAGDAFMTAVILCLKRGALGTEIDAEKLTKVSGRILKKVLKTNGARYQSPGFDLKRLKNNCSLCGRRINNEENK